MGRMKEAVEMMPAPLNSYVYYLLSDKLGLDDEEAKTYNFLSMELIKLPFRYTHPMDENRWQDGMNLRQDFTYETEKFLDSSSGILPGCSFLEMLVALSCKCENQIMRNIDIGNRTKKWFYMMLKCLDFYKMTNKNWQFEYSEEVKNKGNEGKIFHFKTKKVENEEIWKQLMVYLRENYIENDVEGLELYD